MILLPGNILSTLSVSIYFDKYKNVMSMRNVHLHCFMAVECVSISVLSD